MTNQPDTFQRVTVAEAAVILGVSRATVRRRLKAGELTGERVLRPQGSAFVVLLPEDASAARGDASNTRHDAWSVERSNASGDASQGAQETALSAWVVTLMAPLADANARQHETIERQADRIADLARENGTLAERLAAQKRLREAAMARAAELEARLEAAASRPSEPDVAEEVAGLRAEHYRHTAELARADATLAGQAASHARVSRQVRRLWIALAVAGTLAAVGLVAPAWVR